MAGWRLMREGGMGHSRCGMGSLGSRSPDYGSLLSLGWQDAMFPCLVLLTDAISSSSLHSSPPAYLCLPPGRIYPVLFMSQSSSAFSHACLLSLLCSPIPASLGLSNSILSTSPLFPALPWKLELARLAPLFPFALQLKNQSVNLSPDLMYFLSLYSLPS